MPNKTCSICGKEFDGYGNNPSPFSGDSCCDDCNLNIVIQTRIFLITQKRDSALRLNSDNTIEIIKPKGKYFTLKELQKSIGGYIEVYPALYKDHLIVCDEEGMIKNKKFNRLFKKLTTIGLLGSVLLVPEEVFEPPQEEEDE